MLREFRREPQGFPDLLNYFALVEEGILLNKDGSLLAGWHYAGPDMESASPQELAVLSAHVNASLRELGDGWMIQAEAMRTVAAGYPRDGAFLDPTTTLIDEERRASYSGGRKRFESDYVLTVCFLPPPDAQSKLSSFFMESRQARAPGWENVLRQFERQVEQLGDRVSDRLRLAPLGSSGLLSFLHHCATGDAVGLRVPPAPVDLDHLIGSQDLLGGFEPRVGKRHLRPIAIAGLPAESFPGILDFVNELSVEYRWSSRFIAMDPETAGTRLRTLRRNWWQKRQGLSGLAKEALSMGGDSFANQDAVGMATDADEAVTEASSGLVRFGYYTSVILLSGEDKDQLEADARAVLKELHHRGFAARVETINAMEAFLGSLPGHGYRNVRRPLVHTLNFADLIPTTGVFPGLAENPCAFFPGESPPLLYANTSGETPFRFNLHVADVGHSLVIGPTGAGKSTLVGLIAAQFFRYPDAQVFVFDKGYSFFVLAQAAGGEHYAIGEEEHADLSLCPLDKLAEPGEQAWAAEWIAALLEVQGLRVGPAERKEIAVALGRLAGSGSRSLTDLTHTFQDPGLREALRHYTLEGATAGLLDGESDQLGDARFQVFEVERLMNMGPASVVPVLLYLFHRIEQRLDGSPTLLVLEEAWLLLNHPVFARKIEEWLRVLRKRNCSVLFVSQSLADVYGAPQRDLLLESCPTKIFLANPEAQSQQGSQQYRALGLTDRQIDLIASAVPKRHYYYLSPLGRRLLDLALGPVALSFVGASGSEDIRLARSMARELGAGWPAAWLVRRGLSEEADRWKELKGGDHVDHTDAP